MLRTWLSWQNCYVSKKNISETRTANERLNLFLPRERQTMITEEIPPWPRESLGEQLGTYSLFSKGFFLWMFKMRERFHDQPLYWHVGSWHPWFSHSPGRSSLPIPILLRRHPGGPGGPGQFCGILWLLQGGELYINVLISGIKPHQFPCLGNMCSFHIQGLAP